MLPMRDIHGDLFLPTVLVGCPGARMNVQECMRVECMRAKTEWPPLQARRGDAHLRINGDESRPVNAG